MTHPSKMRTPSIHTLFDFPFRVLNKDSIAS